MNTDRSDQPNKNDLTSKPWTSKNNSISYQIVSEIIFRSFTLVCFESLVCFSVPGKGPREETSREKIREEKASEGRRCRCSKTQANILRQEMKNCPYEDMGNKMTHRATSQWRPREPLIMQANRADQPNKNDRRSKPWTNKNNPISKIVLEIIFRRFKLVGWNR